MVRFLVTNYCLLLNNSEKNYCQGRAAGTHDCELITAGKSTGAEYEIELSAGANQILPRRTDCLARHILPAQQSTGERATK
jgi:hypothetical protein